MSRGALKLWLVLLGTLTAGAALLSFALTAWLDNESALLAGCALFGIAAWRLPLVTRDPPRPRWVVDFIDLPAFCLWASGTFALPLFLFGSVGALVARQAGASASLSFEQVAVGSYTFGALLAAWGVWGERQRLRVQTHELVLPSLSRELDGYRVVHMSDLHLGSFVTERQRARWAAAASALDADVVAITGDLVSSGVHYYELAARLLGTIQARDGVFVCLGNHDTRDAQRFTRMLEQQRLVVLSDVAVSPRPGAPLVIAGLDPRRPTASHLAEVLEGLPRDTAVLVLAHYPKHARWLDLEREVLLLAGHSHGGQLGVPGFAHRWNLAVLTGEAPARLSKRGRSFAHVSPGLGTTGPPLRLGITPEITLFILRSREPVLGRQGLGG